MISFLLKRSISLNEYQRHCEQVNFGKHMIWVFQEMAVFSFSFLLVARVLAPFGCRACDQVVLVLVPSHSFVLLIYLHFVYCDRKHVSTL